MEKMFMTQHLAMTLMDALAALAINATGKAFEDLTEEEIKSIESYARNKFIEIASEFETPICTWEVIPAAENNAEEYSAEKTND